MHEEVFRGYTLEAIQNFEKEKPRGGEFVIIIEGGQKYGRKILTKI